MAVNTVNDWVYSRLSATPGSINDKLYAYWYSKAGSPVGASLQNCKQIALAAQPGYTVTDKEYNYYKSLGAVGYTINDLRYDFWYRGLGLSIAAGSDDFNDNSLDTSKWTATANVAESGSQLRITSTTAAGYYSIVGKSTIDLTGKSTSIQCVNAGNQAIPSLETYPLYIQDGPSQTNALMFMINANSLKAIRRVASTNTTVNTGTYTPATHAYFKISESGGTITWWTSSDGTTWNSYGTWVKTIPVTAMYVNIQVGTWQTEGSTTTCIFDNLVTQ